MSTTIQKIEQPPQMLDGAEEYGLPNRDVRATIAVNLQRHLRGTIAGKQGTKGTGKSWHKGDLTFDEALYVVDYAITQGLNPFTDVHVWWYQTLQVTPHYKILVGWANLREPFSASYRPIEDSAERARHQMSDGDIGAVCYILKKSDKARWDDIYKTVIQAQTANGKIDIDLARQAANDAVCVSAVGIVKREEMTDKDGELKAIQVTGWSWLQRAETRALRNALARSHGQPTPAEVQAYSRRLHGGDLKPELLAHEGYNPALGNDDLQLKQLAAADNVRETGKTVDEVANVLRGSEDEQNFIIDEDIPVAETPPDTKPDNEPPEPDTIASPDELLRYANSVSPTPFTNKTQLAKAIKSVLGGKWTYPKENNADGWHKAVAAIHEFLELQGVKL